MTLDNTSAIYRLNLAAALLSVSNFRDAEAACRKAIELAPNYGPGRTRLGVVLGCSGKYSEALPLLEATLKIEPTNPEALLNIPSVLAATGRFTEAIEYQSSALRLFPNNDTVRRKLAVLLAEIGELDEAIELLRKYVTGAHKWTTAHSVLLFLLVHRLEDPDRLFAETVALTRPLNELPRYAVAQAAPKPRWRVGYLSSDFRLHAVSFFMEPVLRSHDQSQFEVYCYSDTVFADDATARLAASCASTGLTASSSRTTS